MLRADVAQLALSQWREPCEAMFEYLAERYPSELLRLVTSAKLRPTDLTFAAEIAGRIRDGQQVRKALLPLLRHTHPVVREGAIYGLAHHLDETVKQSLEDLAQRDSSRAVREVAATFSPNCDASARTILRRRASWVDSQSVSELQETEFRMKNGEPDFRPSV